MSNSARPAPGAALIALGKIKLHGAVAVDFRDGEALFSLILARDENGVHAYENTCPHAQAPLERFDGAVLVQQRRFIICAMHGASFRIADGACVGGPALGTTLKREPVYIDAGIVRLGVGPVAA